MQSILDILFETKTERRYQNPEALRMLDVLKDTLKDEGLEHIHTYIDDIKTLLTYN
jgi:hypothetical protein